MSRFIYTTILLISVVSASFGNEKFVFTENPGNACFPLIINGMPANVFTDESDKGVIRAVNNLHRDFQSVSGLLPTGFLSYAVIIGTAGKSETIDRLIKEGKIDGYELKGKNEKYLIQTIDNPMGGVNKGVVIAGSDKRGTIYGIYELSKQMGVSPWYWWADVPVRHQDNLYVKPGIYTEGEPVVKYRGIFINDEAPAFQGWATKVFGGVNSKMYENMFELILRLKGNFLWPAMWGNAFYDDDPASGALANEMGIVIGTSHHEPMGRAHSEWRRYGKGAWNYDKNSEALREFWRGGMERMKNYETIVTVGMRGDGDEPMSENANVALLQKIVKDQRDIIAKVTRKKTEETPQVWALYKEVQDYFDKGMRVPDDITLMLCDDNWGNVRKLPDLNAPKRKGGYGMYYHFDYVGGPRNYKWLNVTQIQRIWEQMNLTWQYGVDKIWVVNVGDLKPMEYPISFFLDMAWNPARFNPDNLLQHTEEWCAQQFGEKYAKESARLINLYTKYNRRVTPELLNEKTYSLENYNEFERVTQEYKDLLIDASRIYNLLPHNYKDAFDELVLFPVNACSNLYEMYFAVAKNQYYAARNDIRANAWADKAKAGFKRDSVLTVHYNKEIAGGKWPHMMDQIRIGYTTWQQPRKSIMPKVDYVAETSNNREKRFVESDGYISIEAEHYSRAKNGNGITWKVIPDLGKTLSGITTFPVTAIPHPNDAVYLEYDLELKTQGEIRMTFLLAPTLNFNGNKGLRYAVSFDGGEEQIVNFNGHYKGELGPWQAESIIKSVVTQAVTQGKHTLRFRVLEPGIVLEKILIDAGGLKPSYLGAPESEISGIVSLKDALQGKFLIGTAMNANQISGVDTPGIRIIKEQFNSIVAENCMKSEEIQPEEDVFNFDLADKFIAFGQQNGMHINGHTLVWHSQTPKWFFVDENENNVSREVLIERMKKHITTVVSRYKGIVKSWDVVNEAILDDGSFRKSKFYEIIGEDFISLAFQFAHEADPDAELNYNDYSMSNEAKRKGVVRMIKNLQEQGVPIHGVGMQGHLGLNHPSVEEFEKSLLAFSGLGLNVMITELDITVLPSAFGGNAGADVSLNYEYQKKLNPYPDGLPEEKAKELDNRYLDFFKLFLRHKDKITRVTLWGVSDGDSWRNDWPVLGRTDYALLFDRQYNPKPVVKEIVQLAKE
jgi:GH35 family endo-1,4-beta-xylanase